MKVLVFSDSHRSKAGMLDTVFAHQPDQIIHLGDILPDAEELSYAFPHIPVCMVAGNCDGWTTVPAIRTITLAGKVILLSHGHLWGVKGGSERAIAQGRAAGADILLFGHTHIPLCRQLEGGMWMMNPGSARSSYGIIEITDGVISCQLIEME